MEACSGKPEDLCNRLVTNLNTNYFYGAEHAEYSHRCLAIQNRMTISLYPVLKRCTKFFKLNPNDIRVYDFDINKVMTTNQNKMQERDAQTISGLNLKEHHHHLNNELIIKRNDSKPEEKIKELLAKRQFLMNLTSNSKSTVKYSLAIATDFLAKAICDE